MLFDGTAIFRLFSRACLGRFRQDRFDHLVLKDSQGGNGLQALGRCFVKSTAGFLNELFATQLFQVIRSLPRLVGPFRISQYLSYLGRYLGAAPTLRQYGQRQNRAQDRAQPRFVHVHPGNPALPHLRRHGQIVPRLVVQASHVHAAHHLQKPLQHLLQTSHYRWELLQLAAQPQLAGIVHDRLDAQHALAFAIHLQGQFPAMDLEHRQIVAGSLDHDFPSRLLLLPTAATLATTEDRLDRPDVQGRTRAINHSLKNFLQDAAFVEQQIATVFRLINRELIPKAALLLLGHIQRQAQTHLIKPMLAGLLQAPYSVQRTQGICDFAQTCGIGIIRETVVLLAKLQSLLLGLAGHIFVAIDDDLGRERWMPTHFDDQMPPRDIPDVKRIMIHVRLMFRAVDVDTAVAKAMDRPDRKRCPLDDDAENAWPLRHVRTFFLDPFVGTFLARAFDDRNLVLLGPPIHAPTEAPRQTHQMGIIQVVIGAIQEPPPNAKSTRRTAQRKVSIQHDAIDAVVRAIQKLAIVLAERVIRDHDLLQVGCPEKRYESPSNIPAAPQGATFPGAVPDKA